MQEKSIEGIIKGGDNRIKKVEEEEINLLDYLLVLKKYWGLIMSISTIIILSSLIYSMLSPKVYQARASILTQTGKFNPTELVKMQNLGGLPFFSFSTEADSLIAILKSRRMQEAIIRNFNLQDIYKLPYIEDVCKVLEKKTTIKKTKEGVVEVYFEACDRVLARDIANFYVTYLDVLNRELAQSSAKNARIFVEGRLLQTKDRLRKAEAALEYFKKKHGIVEITEQAKALIEASSNLKAELTAAEIQLKIMQYSAQGENPEVEKLKLRIQELRRRMANMTSGGRSSDKDIYPKFKKVPELSRQLSSLIREVKVQENLFNLLTELYEKAKLEEVKDTPTIQILDLAKIPQRHIKPNLKLNLIVSTVLGLFISVFLAFFIEYLTKIKTIK